MNTRVDRRLRPRPAIALCYSPYHILLLNALAIGGHILPEDVTVVVFREFAISSGQLARLRERFAAVHVLPGVDRLNRFIAYSRMIQNVHRLTMLFRPRSSGSASWGEFDAIVFNPTRIESRAAAQRANKLVFVEDGVEAYIRPSLRRFTGGRLLEFISNMLVGVRHPHDRRLNYADSLPYGSGFASFPDRVRRSSTFEMHEIRSEEFRLACKMEVVEERMSETVAAARRLYVLPFLGNKRTIAEYLGMGEQSGEEVAGHIASNNGLVKAHPRDFVTIQEIANSGIPSVTPHIAVESILVLLEVGTEVVAGSLSTRLSCEKLGLSYRPMDDPA